MIDLPEKRHNRAPIRRKIDWWLLRNRSAIGWAVVALAVIGAVVLGAIGFEKNLRVNAPGESYSLLTRVFMTLQMLTLNEGGAPEPVSWELEAARFLAVLAFSATLLKAAAVIFRDQFAAIALRWISGHTIVCGLDEKGTPLATELLEQGERAVIVERRSEDSPIQNMRELGAYVIVGDATERHVLAKTGLTRAKRLIIVSGKDAVNVQVAAVAEDLCRKDRSLKLEPLPVHVHCTDPRLFSLLERSREPKNRDLHETTRETAKIVDCRRFDVRLNAARILLEQHPLDRVHISADSELRIQVLFLGYTAESQSVLLQTARLAHYANLKPPRVIVADPEAVMHLQRLRFRYPQVDRILEVEHIARNLDHEKTMRELANHVHAENTLSTVIVATENHDLSLQAALAFQEAIVEQGIPIHIKVDNRDEFASLLRGDSPRRLWFPLGSTVDAGSAAMIIRAELDQVARAIHEDYVRRRIEEGKSVAEYPAMRPWDELSESDREANRHQADHLSVKLRAVDCIAVDLECLDGRSPASWTENEIELMAKMEHQRWCANRFLEGWQPGQPDQPQDRSRKLHPNLIPWEDIDEPTREYDRDAVRQIPELLSLVGSAVVRVDAT